MVVRDKDNCFLADYWGHSYCSCGCCANFDWCSSVVVLLLLLLVLLLVVVAAVDEQSMCCASALLLAHYYCWVLG